MRLDPAGQGRLPRNRTCALGQAHVGKRTKPSTYVALALGAPTREELESKYSFRSLSLPNAQAQLRALRLSTLAMIECINPMPSAHKLDLKALVGCSAR